MALAPAAVSVLEKYARRLVPVFPPQSAPGVNAEDYWHQALDDQVCRLAGIDRDPAVTRSAEALAVAGPPYGGSANHKREEHAVEYVRTSDPGPVSEFLAQEAREGWCFDELGGRYVPTYHAFPMYVTWLFAKERRHTALQLACERWFQHMKWWWLQSVVVGKYTIAVPGKKPLRIEDPIISAGLRRVFCPDPRDSYHYWLYTGRAFNVEKIRGDENSRGGYPSASGVWLGAAALAHGLRLRAMKPLPPPMSFDLRFITRDHNYVLSYFPTLKWRPGGTDILVACEFGKGMAAPKHWLVEHGDAIPAPTWGFDPVKKEIWK